jgi:carbonic anhydrase
MREQNLHILNPLDSNEASIKLAEINVRHGLRVLSENNTVLDAMHDRGLKLHGVLYDVGSGILRKLDNEEPEDIILARLAAFKTTKA